MDSATRKAYRWFRLHAGYGAATCLSLARAERWAEDADVSFRWEPDLEEYLTDIPGDCPKEVLGCVATLGDETVSLWGIGDPDDAYARVVQAELASELRVPFFTAIRQHMDMLR